MEQKEKEINAERSTISAEAIEAIIFNAGWNLSCGIKTK